MENYRKLGPRLQRFAEAIVEGATGAEAVRRIRPKARRPKEQAYKWRHLPEVNAAIEELRAEAVEDAGVTLARVLKETARVAFANLRELFDAQGALLPIDEWPEDAARAVVGIDFEALFEGRGEDRHETGHIVKVKTAPKVEALRLLGQYLKAWTEKHELTGKDGLPLPSSQQTVYVIEKAEATQIRGDLDERV